MNDQFIKDVMEYLREYMRLYGPMFQQHFRDLHYGTRSIDDQMHAKWFMLMTMANPNWVRALPFVRGGSEELRRFERTTGIKLLLEAT